MLGIRVVNLLNCYGIKLWNERLHEVQSFFFFFHKWPPVNLQTIIVIGLLKSSPSLELVRPQTIQQKHIKKECKTILMNQMKVKEENKFIF